MKRKILIILSFIMAQALCAQNFHVQDFREDPSDVAAVRFPHTDVNDHVCAIIKVRSNIGGILFDSNLGISKIDERPDGIWLYVSPGERALRFMRQGVITKDYNFPAGMRMESSKVYILELLATTGEVDDPEIETQWLIITSEPDGADVYINDEPAGRTPYQNELPVGTYQWRLESSLYLPTEGFVSLESGDGKRKQFHVTLDADYGTLVIRSRPESGANVALNGINTSESTPATLRRIPSGEHTITLSMDDYARASQQIELRAGEHKEVVVDMRPTFAVVRIDTEPTSDIYINDQRRGSGSWQGRLSTGVYTFEARRDSHKAHSERMQVRAGEDFNLSLQPEPITGNLRIISLPIGAQIRVNGEDSGTAPNTFRNLLIGEYDVALSHPGHARVNKRVTVAEGETAELNVELPTGMEVTITSNPMGAALFINGERVGTTPYTNELGFGSHQLRLVNQGGTVEESIEIRQGGRSDFLFDVAVFRCGINKLVDERDGNEYETVQIGSQCWMKENLKWLPSVSRPSNGSGTSPHYYVNGYEGNRVSEATGSVNYRTYGVLYNWPAALNACPPGWRLPSDQDWEILTDHLGGRAVAGGKMKTTGTSHWNRPNIEATNESGFSALPGGLRWSSGSFGNVGDVGHWWSATEGSGTSAWSRNVGSGNGDVTRGYLSKRGGFSVRCLRDN